MHWKNELDFFVAKFQKLLEAGFTAHLDVDANAGQAWVGLRVMLGSNLRQNQKEKKRRGPAYDRRQERRRAARENADKATTHAKKTAEVFDEGNAEEAIANTKTFECESCHFSCNKADDLCRHASKNHAKFSEMEDGESCSDEEAKESKCS